MKCDESGWSTFFVCHPGHDKPVAALEYRKCKTAAVQCNSLTRFCFPLKAEQRQTKRMASVEVFSFVRTCERGLKGYGFCRKIYCAPGSAEDKKRPIVLCLLATDVWIIFYNKVLEVVEHCLKNDDLLQSRELNLPPGSDAAKFLNSVNRALSRSRDPSLPLRLKLPFQHEHNIQPPQRIPSLKHACPELSCTKDFIHLQVPPVTGGSPELASVSLACLLWQLPVNCLMSLIASLLMERHIILVSANKERLSAAFHAASALIYPFKWVHIPSIPVLPEDLNGLLQASMPFLIGLPAELNGFEGLRIEEPVLVVDLDEGTCLPKPGTPDDDALRLPKRHTLEGELRKAVESLRSPTEFEVNERVANIMQSYFLSLFKDYRKFVQEIPRGKKLKNWKTLPKDPQPEKAARRSCLSVLLCRRSRKAAPQTQNLLYTSCRDAATIQCDKAIDEGGLYFDHVKYVESRKSPTVQSFLEDFYGSQMYHDFITERLRMMKEGVYPKDDPFEARVSLIAEKEQDRKTVRLKPGKTVMRTWTRCHTLRNSFCKVPPMPAIEEDDTEPLIKKYATSRQLLVARTSQSGLASNMGAPKPPLGGRMHSMANKRTSSRRLRANFSIKMITDHMAQDAKQSFAGSEKMTALYHSRAHLHEMNPEAAEDPLPESSAILMPVTEETFEQSGDDEEPVPASARSRSFGVSASFVLGKEVFSQVPAEDGDAQETRPVPVAESHPVNGGEKTTSPGRLESPSV